MCSRINTLFLELIQSSIIHRAGILPLSVAGVFKEVTTISISAWVFGDQLSELNIVGVVIAVSGASHLANLSYLWCRGHRDFG